MNLARKVVIRSKTNSCLLEHNPTYMQAIKIQERKYQSIAITAVADAFRRNVRRVLLYAPTGAGKTIMFTSIAHRTLEKAQRLSKETRIWIIAHREELVNQSSEKLMMFQIRHGLIKGGSAKMYNLPVQVASVQSLVRRLEELPAPDLIIIDEAHHAPAGSWDKVAKAFPKAWILGVTATPIRSDGKGLDGSFDELIIPRVDGQDLSTRYLMDEGWLTRYRVYSPKVQADTAGLRKSSSGDYTRDDAQAVVDKPTITGSAVQHYQEYANEQPAIAFCVSVLHAQHVCAEFQAAGYRAAVFADDITSEERKAMLQGLADGTYHVLCACDMISEGTDVPVCSVAILMRPTMSLGLHLQQVGRVLRPVFAEGYDLSTKEGRLAAIAASVKPYAIIIDMVGNVGRREGNKEILKHGYPDDVWKWSLDSKTPAVRGESKSDDQPRLKPKIVCKGCLAHIPIAPSCPYCGYAIPLDEGGRTIIVTEGELAEMRRQVREEAEAAAAAKKAENTAMRKEAFNCTNVLEMQAVAEKYSKDSAWVFKTWGIVSEWRKGKGLDKPKAEPQPQPKPEPVLFIEPQTSTVDRIWEIEGAELRISDDGLYVEAWVDGEMVGEVSGYYVPDEIYRNIPR